MKPLGFIEFPSLIQIAPIMFHVCFYHCNKASIPLGY